MCTRKLFVTRHSDSLIAKYLTITTVFVSIGWVCPVPGKEDAMQQLQTQASTSVVSCNLTTLYLLNHCSTCVYNVMILQSYTVPSNIDIVHCRGSGQSE